MKAIRQLLFVSMLIGGTTSHAIGQQTPPVLLQMVRDDAVHQELKLSDDQVMQLIAALRPLDERWFRSRNQPQPKQQSEIAAVTQQLRSQLAKLIDPPQLTRLRQLERQALGTRMVLLKDVASSLGLSDSQLESLTASFVETDQESAEIQQQIQQGKRDSESGNRELSRLKAKEQQSLAGRLTDEQKSMLGSLTGRPFSFNQVRRTFPLAPELTSQGVTWIQGGPLSLEQLRGKVVAVHFYAFQCINCQRNLPHYQSWFKDFPADQFVVIGIQTPETPSERQLDRVAAAAEKEGMEYPLLLDAEESNWKTWSNTMWPTVYLIDKKGFLRRWWQGEMNWEGTPGEQQMRQTIEQLLSEES